MAWFVLGVFLLFSVIVLLRWYANAPPETVWRALRWTGLALAVIVGLVLLFRGGLTYLWIAGAFLVPWLMRRRAMRGWEGAARSRPGGQRSTVRTRFVAMELDHDTGAMDGEVREGPLAGRRLSGLSLDELLGLLALAAAQDQQSAQVLQSYLDRVHGDVWRERARAGGEEGAGEGPGAGSGDRAGPGKRSSGGMSREEAWEVLGLAPGAGEAEIKAAHRRLIQQYHPDHGGTDYLAAKINEAKDLLLGD